MCEQPSTPQGSKAQTPSTLSSTPWREAPKISAPNLGVGNYIRFVSAPLLSFKPTMQSASVSSPSEIPLLGLHLLRLLLPGHRSRPDAMGHHAADRLQDWPSCPLLE